MQSPLKYLRQYSDKKPVKQVILSKWFGAGLAAWCAGFLWFDAWYHYKWSCVLQFIALGFAVWGLYNQGYSDALKWSSGRLDEIIEQSKKRVENLTAPKKPENTWLA